MSTEQTPTWWDLKEQVAVLLDAHLAHGGAMGGAMGADNGAMDAVMTLHAEIQAQGRDDKWSEPASADAIARTVAAQAAAVGITTPHADYRAPVGDEFDNATALLAARGVGDFSDLPEGLRMRMTNAVVEASKETGLDQPGQEGAGGEDGAESEGR